MGTAQVGEATYTVSLQDLTNAAYQAAYASHGDLDLGIEEYSNRLIAITRKFSRGEYNAAAASQLLGQLHTSDLYLSAACALHRDAAWRRFDALFRKYMNDLVTYICSTRSIATEIRETIAVHLFLPDNSGHSRISSYDGRSSLATWLRVIVTHRIINEGERKCNALHHGEPRPEFEDHSALPFIEGCLKLGRYEPLVCAAVRRACETLSEKEKALVLWRFDQEAQLGEIARKLGVHQSTITRNLDRIARKLRNRVISNLSASCGDSASIDECLSILVDGNCQSLSILDCIRGERPS